MPTWDNEGPPVVRLFQERESAAIGAVAVLRACAIEAHDDWQAALAASLAAGRAAREAIGTGAESFAFDKSAALHLAAKRAELTFSRARERWFGAQPGLREKYRRRFQFGDCL